MTQCHFVEEKMPDSVEMKAYLGMIAECCSFISVTVTSPLAKTSKQLRESFIWLTILSHSLSFQRSQDRASKGWSHHMHSQEQRERNTLLPASLS